MSPGGGLREQWLSNAFHREAVRCGGRLGAESAAKLAARLMTARRAPAVEPPGTPPPPPPPSLRGRATPALEAAQERIAQKLVVSLHVSVQQSPPDLHRTQTCRLCAMRITRVGEKGWTLSHGGVRVAGASIVILLCNLETLAPFIKKME